MSRISSFTARKLHFIFVIFVIVSICWLVFQLEVIEKCFGTVPLQTLSTFLLEDDVSCHRNQVGLMHHLLQYLKQEKKCHVSLEKFWESRHELPTIFFITPTYSRPVQKAELTRISHTLRLVPNIHWILVEDSINKTKLVSKFLSHCQLPHTHLNIPTPPDYKTTERDPNWLKPRGVLQRNLGLKWLREHLNLSKVKGVVYFGDDDNTYDLELFEEMRYTRKVSVWPVALVGGLMVERPVVINGKVVSWNTLWKADRPFPVDMAGFAVNVTLLLEHQEAEFSLKVPRGYQESHLLKYLVKIEDLEPRANNCTKVLVWHTRTEPPKLKQEKKLKIPSNQGIEV